MAEVSLTEEGGRVLREAEQFCWRTNVAIVAPEHLLAGALLVLSQAGRPGLPPPETLEAALLDAQGSGDTELTSNVMFGSAAREAINGTALAVRQAGGTLIDARILAMGVIASGEVTPMFFGALGTTRQELMAALG
ncbi:MAG: hypothetical protein HYX53_08680 [Chloroflexi bacterium]|nr:hypothetical protein [Chloroflexota bacterium]